MPLPVVTLKPGHVQPVWAGHPWVFQQAIASVGGGARPGDLVAVHDPRGTFLGKGFFSPGSALAVRVLTRDEHQEIDGEFFRVRVRGALAARRALHLPNADTNAYRLVHAEGDGLPGFVADVFDDVVVAQFGSLGMKQREGLLFEALESALSPRAIVDRTSVEMAKREGFEAARGVVRGEPGGATLTFRERGFSFRLPEELGQKTGFYFDQRPLRARVEQLARGATVLDVYAFLGTFSLAAARGGAREVTAVDASALALEIGAETARANGLGDSVRWVRGDARDALARAGVEGGHDLVICDPPKLAPSRAKRETALTMYKRLAEAAAAATKPGGLLVFCSCSSAVRSDDLVRALALGAEAAGRTAIVLERHFQGADHPVPAAFPEGLYLKSVIARIERRR